MISGSEDLFTLPLLPTPYSLLSKVPGQRSGAAFPSQSRHLERFQQVDALVKKEAPD